MAIRHPYPSVAKAALFLVLAGLGNLKQLL